MLHPSVCPPSVPPVLKSRHGSQYKMPLEFEGSGVTLEELIAEDISRVHPEHLSETQPYIMHSVHRFGKLVMLYAWKLLPSQS